MNRSQQKIDILRSAIRLDELGPAFGLAIGVVAVFVLLVLMFFLTRLVTDFSAELRLLNMEIERSEDEQERQHYLRRRRRLWLSLLPFVKY